MTELEADQVSARGITHTFRLDQDVKAKLDQLSQRENKSVNALANKALRRLVEWDANSELFGNMAVSPKLLTKLMEYVSVGEARELGEWASISVFSDLVQFLFQKRTLTSFIATLALLDKYTGAFTLEHGYSKGKHTIILLHKMGVKWSAFYEELATSMVRALKDQVEKVSAESTENQVVITIEVAARPLD